ncbi:pre-mRNA-processing ATP-dependent RNA helicase prp5-like [Miscanthus floridulus]|uniref:pre-mRNA-processing ATP-dependent RNA helicase prp5-like n=1 Tax=Miscanthus floridulus TaxID=154761 RepID=UPI00345A6813
MESQPERWRYGVPLAEQSKLQPLLRALERLRSRGLTEGRQRSSDLTLFLMCLLWGYISLGMRDVRASPPPVPEDAERRVENRAHAEAYKERKDAEEARRKRKSLERDELEKRRRQQGHDGLPEEPSPSSSSMDFLSDDYESEAGRGPLDHLLDVRETAPGASASGLASLGGGGEGTSGLAIARPGAEADTPETRASRKRAVSLMERATVGVTQPPSHRAEGVLESGEGWPVSVNTGVVPLPPPPPLPRMRDTVRKLLLPRSRPQLVTQGEATEAATKQVGEEAPTPYEAGATEGEAEAPRTSEAEVAEAGASRASEAEVADVGAPRSTEAEVVEVGAPRTTKAEVAEAGFGTAELAAQDVETEAGQALVPPPVQDLLPSQESAREVEVHSISSDDISQGKEVADAEVTSTMEQPALTSGEGSSALVRELEAWSLEKSMFLRWERDIWD